jgi:hypothetical protein
MSMKVEPTALELFAKYGERVESLVEALDDLSDDEKAALRRLVRACWRAARVACSDLPDGTRKFIALCVYAQGAFNEQSYEA